MLEEMLINTEPGHELETTISFDQRVAVINHGLMRARPADTELARHLRDGVQLGADTPTDLPPGALGQRRAGCDLIGRFGPRPAFAQLLAATPGALGPHQHHRRPSDREITYQHPTATVPRAKHRARRTPTARPRRLNQQPPLAVMHRLRNDLEPIQVEQHRRVRAATTVSHVGGLQAL